MIKHKKHRIYLLDIIRIVCALLIFMRHSISMYSCTYGSQSVDEVIISLTGPVMSMFFILSGFSISYSNYSDEEWDYRKTNQFYAKRLVQIIPTYLLIHVLWLILGSDSFMRWAFLTPFELTVLQSMYPNIFGVLHNGGTWFISCLLLSYLIYPAARGILFRLNKKTILFLTAITMFLLVYIPAVGAYYALGGIYSNPVFRSLEFVFGVLVSNCAITASELCNNEKNKLPKNLVGLSICVIGCVIFVHFLKNPMSIGNPKLGLCNSQLILYPLIVCLLCVSVVMRCKALENNKLLNYFSGLTYYFYIFQLILWTVTASVSGLIEKVSGIEVASDIARIALSFTICLLMSVAVNAFFDKPIKNFCFNHFSIFKQKNPQS